VVHLMNAGGNPGKFAIGLVLSVCIQGVESVLYGSGVFACVQGARGKIEYSLDRYLKWLNIDDPEVA
jgi:hypothetical protein